jgi:hypothetical protein
MDRNLPFDSIPAGENKIPISYTNKTICEAFRMANVRNVMVTANEIAIKK